MHARTLMIALCLALAACATTKVTAFRDPAFAGKRYTKLAVFVRGASLPVAQEMEQRICGALGPQPCLQGLELLPPTRQYTADDVTAKIASSGADAVLIVKIGKDENSSGVIGYQTFATAQATGTATTTGTLNTYGNMGTYSGTTVSNAQATGQSTTMPIMFFSRAADGAVTLIDTATGKTAWTGMLQTSGQGLLNVTDSAFQSSQCREIVAQLKVAGFVPR